MADPQSYIPSETIVSEWLSVLQGMSLRTLMDQACDLRRQGHGELVSFSPKVFIPVTRLCRDACGYCTFAKSPRAVANPFMSPDEILDVARRGAEAGCTEALFTLGDRPEQRYRVAQDALVALGHETTNGYLEEMARLVQREAGLLVHLNAGILAADEIARMRRISVSQGLMLESTSTRLGQKGGPHYGCASKLPAVRIAMIEAAGQRAVPFTTGILIGIGETRRERVESLLTIRNLHDTFGHIQEVIVQNFLPKPGTGMASAAKAAFEELLWTVAAARHLLGAQMHIQAPPNLSFVRFADILAAGIDDWGGVSPVTPDFVNPEAPWPEISALRTATAKFGCHLVARLPIYPEYLRDGERWVDRSILPVAIRSCDSDGWARSDSWSPGLANAAMQSFPIVIERRANEID
jgi:FO synthase